MVPVRRRGPEAFSLRPAHTLMAIVDDPDEASAAVRELAETGFDEEDIEVLAGERGIERIDASGDEHGLSGVLTRVAQGLFGPEHAHAVRHEKELRDGHLVISLPTHNVERQKRAHAILKKHGGHFIHVYGRWSVRTLEP